MPKENQSEGEFFALVSTGRKGVEDMLAKMGGEIQAVAAPNVGKSFDTWKTRALVEVSGRDELRGTLQTREGIYSVYKSLAKAATMGLQIGGQYPHAYLVPMGGKATLVPTADGLAFAAAHGPGAVLARVPKLEHVHEKDTFRVDAAAATVEHSFEAFKDRGKVVGYYMALDYLDGHREIATITQEKVEAIEKAYSNKGGPAWTKSPQEMHDSKAAKQLLKKPAKEAEGLAMLLSLDDYQPPEYTPPPRDMEERLGGRLEGAMRDVTESAEEPEVKPESQAQGAKADEKDIF